MSTHKHIMFWEPSALANVHASNDLAEPNVVAFHTAFLMHGYHVTDI